MNYCSDALPFFKELLEIYDLENIVKYIIMFGSTETVDYDRFKNLLSNDTIGQSLSDSGTILFRSNVLFFDKVQSNIIIVVNNY